MAGDLRAAGSHAEAVRSDGGHAAWAVEGAVPMPGSPKAFDQKTREFSMKRAVAILDGLRGGGAAMRKAS